MPDQSQMRQFILDRISDRLVQLNIDSSTLADDFDLMESGTIDSMEFVNLIGEIEMAFSIDLDFSELDPSEFTTLGGLVNCASTGGATGT